jgi:hypothetical protein
MKVRTKLLALARAVADECDQNAPFRKKIEEALGSKLTAGKKADPASVRAPRPHRRARAVLDPISLVKVSEFVLRRRLDELEIEQLKDIVAQYGMDPSKLVMKWKDASRIAEHILETSMVRATKGDAFRT